MTNLLKASFDKDGFKLEKSGLPINIQTEKLLPKDVFVVIRNLEKPLEANMEVVHQGEKYIVENVSQNGWVKFVGITNKTRITQVKALNPVFEDVYTLPTEQEIKDFIGEKLDGILSMNIFKIILSIRTIIKEIKILVDLLKSNKV